MSHGCGCDLPLVHSNNVVVDLTRVHKRIVIDHSHAIRHSLIYIGDVVDVIDGHVVVHICDLSDVHSSVSDVDVLHVARTGAVPGHEYFPRPEREPTYSAADSNSDAKATTANECH